MNQKIGILVVLASVLLSAGLLATPSLKVVNAQGNETKMQGLNVDGWINDLKSNHPALANIAEDKNVMDAIAKIKGMKDPVEVTKNLEALDALQKLIIIKALQSGQ